ncbi:acyl-CoA dehydrogenase [Cecembia lonarensis]|uniref:Acyl-CoA dehydrogenase, short-chain specific n=1 Tax=Cecembia lonarensis (strain CCUG 58316 / KCTC 22772 / LW9) TaxID=1225176 RepID=K1LX82_CECL9|nr:acyl-CoA dehydrogenase [Cecembia lonarensis]EKB48749.1 Acyl-CoA dehydrogenase, short-chain specific [Cecembia lonarensis LW9]
MPFYSNRDLQFQLFENLQVLELTQYEHFKDHSVETFQMVIEAAAKIAETSLYPLLTEMDRDEPQLVNGKIRIHAGMKKIIRQFGEDGWINATFSYDEGGQQLPNTLHMAAGFIFQAANYSASVYPFLTTGAANLIRTFGNKELIETFTPNMYAGKWQGTMALTEPDAGSSLSDLSTMALPTEKEGVYKIKGQKIYISCGDHDACENVIHLMLARIQGAPLGIKGISLFVVPQKRVSNGESNDVLTEGVYHKMGYKGAPIAHLMIGSNDGCEGYLVGEANKGLSYMFQMMNEARVGVGMNAAAIGTAAYYASLAYAKERPQGRKIGDKDPSQPQIPIIQHADVKRMLLFQKSITEGTLSLLLYCSKLGDIAHAGDGNEKEEAALLLDFLTPIAKSYPSEMCCLTTSTAVQVLGGAGYTTDFPVEQYYREARIHPIHEGTTGIHGLDLLGRKAIMQEGKALKLFVREISKTILQAKDMPAIKGHGEKLEKYLQRAQQTVGHLFTKVGKNPEAYLADATLFLEYTGILAIAWQWLKQAITAQQQLDLGNAENAFYQGKIMCLRYFFEYELVKMDALGKRLMAEDMPTLEMQEDWF